MYIWALVLIWIGTNITWGIRCHFRAVFRVSMFEILGVHGVTREAFPNKVSF